MNYILISSVQDTVSFINQCELTDFYKDIASVQSTQFTVLVTVISVVFTVVVGATWWFNYRAAKSQITEEINVAVNEIEKKYLEVENKFKSLQEDLVDTINEEIEAKIEASMSESLGVYSERIDKIDKSNEEKLNEFQENVNNKITHQQAELARVFALHCNSNKSYFNAFTWWVSAAEYYHSTDNGEFTQITVMAALDAVNKIEKKEVDKDKLSSYGQRIKDNIPDILASEKKKILKKIDELCDNSDSKA